MSKIKFDPDEEGGLELARVIVLERLRKDKDWKQYDLDGKGFAPFVEYIGDEQMGRDKLTKLALDVLWEFSIQGIVAPGLDPHNANFPWFRITEYGQKVLDGSGEFPPHDATGYLERFRRKTPNLDPTVEAYLSESLYCFEKGNLIASVVMLGIASERVFLLLCGSLTSALRVCPESWYCVTSISTEIYKRSFDGDLAKDAIERNPTPTVSVIRLLLKWLRPFKVYPPLY